MSYLILAATPSTAAGIITAIATLLTAIGVLITAVAVLVPILRTVRIVHTIVNQQHTDMQRYQVALIEALRVAGIVVPIDQSLPVPGHDDAKPGQPT